MTPIIAMFPHGSRPLLANGDSQFQQPLKLLKPQRALACKASKRSFAASESALLYVLASVSLASNKLLAPRGLHSTFSFKRLQSTAKSYEKKGV